MSKFDKSGGLENKTTATAMAIKVVATTTSAFINNIQNNNVVVVVCSGLTSLSIIFQSYHDSLWLRQGAQCSLVYSAVSLTYHAPVT